MVSVQWFEALRLQLLDICISFGLVIEVKVLFTVKDGLTPQFRPETCATLVKGKSLTELLDSVGERSRWKDRPCEPDRSYGVPTKGLDVKSNQPEMEAYQTPRNSTVAGLLRR